MTKKTHWFLALLWLLAGCAHPIRYQPEPVSFTADIEIVIDSTAPAGLWMYVYPANDTVDRIALSHLDPYRCVWFTVDSIPTNLIIEYGAVDMHGYSKLIWAPSFKRNHLDIIADSTHIHTYVMRSEPCGKDEGK